MRQSVFLALGLALAAVVWILSGQFGDKDREAEANSEKTKPAPEAPIQSVRVMRIKPSMKQRAIIVNGRAEASRTVELRSEIIGSITFVGAKEGARVKKGEVVARIALQDRKARLAESKALLRQRQMEYRAAKQLSKKGFRSTTKLAESQAYLDTARARLRRMEVEMSNTRIVAPFDGVLEDRNVEVGAYVKEGGAIGKLVDLDPALIVAHVSERNVGRVRPGMKGSAKLIDGRVVEGTVRFVSNVADPATRSFKVELEVPNPDGVVRDGVTAELSVPLPPITAYRLSPAVLTLDVDGRVGVKVVDADNKVVFVPVKILADEANGVWVDGLPNDPLLITVGHEFVKSGQKVNPVPAGSEPTS